MKKEDAKRLIISEWRDWKKTRPPSDNKPTGTDALIFFGNLQSNHPELLDFRYSGDKWQIVHSWLLSSGLVTD
jgi:hypothetical protein